MPVIVAVGVPGVGKTSVLNSAIDLLKREGFSEVEVVNFGDKMVEEAIRRGLIKDFSERDKIRKMAISVQVDLQIKAAEAINKLASEGGKVVIVDTHMFIRTPVSFLPGLPNYVLEALKPRGIVVIIADPKDILNRRYKDRDIRDRDVEEVSDIEFHQRLTVEGAIATSIFTGANIVIIRNEEGKLEEAALKLVNFIKSLS